MRDIEDFQFTIVNDSKFVINIRDGGQSLSFECDQLCPHAKANLSKSSQLGVEDREYFILCPGHLKWINLTTGEFKPDPNDIYFPRNLKLNSKQLSSIASSSQPLRRHNSFMVDKANINTVRLNAVKIPPVKISEKCLTKFAENKNKNSIIHLQFTLDQKTSLFTPVSSYINDLNLIVSRNGIISKYLLSENTQFSFKSIGIIKTEFPMNCDTFFLGGTGICPFLQYMSSIYDNNYYPIVYFFVPYVNDLYNVYLSHFPKVLLDNPFVTICPTREEYSSSKLKKFRIKAFCPKSSTVYPQLKNMWFRNAIKTSGEHIGICGPTGFQNDVIKACIDCRKKYSVL